ncbi:hypothetical protein WV31_19735 [Magnetospirillum sp. ME-1]|nr:hypothetical protein WV31_19735 [Magnetospirillum sp. ME-1]
MFDVIGFLTPSRDGFVIEISVLIMPDMALPNGCGDHYQRLITVKCSGNLAPAMIRFIRLEMVVGGKFALHAKASRTRRN